MKNILVIFTLAFVLVSFQAKALPTCEQLRTEKEQVLLETYDKIKDIKFDDKHDGTISAGEQLYNLSIKEVNDKYNYLLSVEGCYK
jgi:hypothetical protein